MMTGDCRNIRELIQEHLKNRELFGSEVLNIKNGKGEDIYNCSVPFEFEGKTYLWGRVENRKDWATSIVLLFEQREDGAFVRSDKCEALPLEDPFIGFINGEYVMGGVHVVKQQGQVKTYYTYFYRGSTPFSFKYFTTGPEYMKDIRLVQLPEGKIGIFSRPRNAEIAEQFGSESQIGFAVINHLDELNAEVIERAEYIDGIFGPKEWGGVNQAFYLGGNLIGIIGHHGYNEVEHGVEYPVYVNVCYIFDYVKRKIVHQEVIGTRQDYPLTESKLATLTKCAFTSGIRMVDGGKVALYSGLSDVAQGKIIIPNPFRGYGNVVYPQLA